MEKSIKCFSCTGIRVYNCIFCKYADANSGRVKGGRELEGWREKI